MLKKIFSKIGNAFAFAWKHNKAFIITASCLLAFFFAATMVATQVAFIRNTINTSFGDERRVLVKGDPSKAQYYTLSEGITNKAGALAAANKLNERIGEEGFVLLKNEGSLPLSQNAKISVFGINSVNLVYGGSGSGGKDSSGAVDLYQSLSNAGIDYNGDLKSFYDGQKAAGKGRGKSPGFGAYLEGFATGELQLSDYSGGISQYYGSHTDAALVVFSRIGGEGFDLPRTMKSISGSNPADHYLQLDNNERALLGALCAENSPFSNVIAIINAGTSMELGFLDDPAYGGKLKGALWVGTPGGTGINALGKILRGEINPSGRTVDTFAKDFTKDPTWQNFGRNFSEDGNLYHIKGGNQEARFIDYEEGIYAGYRYYETRGFTDGAAWYQSNVSYPLGYGLSYSDFEWEPGAAKLVKGSQSVPLSAALTAADADKSISVDVTVRNMATSLKDGKDVVQLYVKAPYTGGGIEKAHVILADFAKTDMLVKGGASQTVTLSFSLSDIASYDYSDANGNGFKGFEAEAGEYTVYVARNAHSWAEGSVLSFSFTVPETAVGATKGKTGFRYEDAATPGKKVENRFDDVSGHISKYLSRSDWNGTFPTTPTYDDRSVSEELIYSMTEEYYIGKSGSVDKGKKWFKPSMPKLQRTPLSEKETTVKLYDLIYKDYDDPMWDKLLSQLTLSQMRNLIGTGNYNTAAIPSIHKPKTTDPDGPVGFANFMTIISSAVPVYDTCFYASACVVGATWNKDLAREMGVAVGNEGLAGNERGDKRPYSGWYAPAVNIHRSPFSGRNWEYYSEDGLLSGKMAAAIVQGAMSKGVYTYVKHFALNDQETDRDTFGLITWASEQSMRELYFKPFELTVKEGKTRAIMSSFNRIGTVWAGGSYELLTEVLRDEWGFRGMVITDYNVQAYMPANQMIRAGGDLNLIQDKQPAASGSSFTTSHVHAMRAATKNILYTVAKSNAMNGMGAGIVYRYALPYWTILLITADAALVGALGIWGFFTLRKSIRKNKKNYSG